MKDDGGAAFPRPPYYVPDDVLYIELMHEQDGMSMREWYAGQALIGLVIANENQDKPLGWHPASVANAAVDYADAMVKRLCR